MTIEEFKELDKNSKFGKLNGKQQLKVWTAYNRVLKVVDRMYYEEIDALLERVKDTIDVSSQFVLEYTPGFDD